MATCTLDALGQETHFIYDKLGRLTETIAPDATPADLTDNPRTKTQYDKAGRVLAQIDERGNRTEFEYDAAGRRLLTRDALGNITTNTYNPAGNRLTETNARGYTTSYTYDKVGRPIETLYADGTLTLTHYNTIGLRDRSTDQSGHTTTYLYDVLNRPVQVLSADATPNDLSDNPRTKTEYNELDRRTNYEYDGVGRRIATVLPLGMRSTTTYNPVGNIQSMTDFNGATTLYRYDEQNRLKQKSFADGSQVVYSYTLNNLQDTIRFIDPTGAATAVYDYDYDERNRLIQRTDILGTGASQTTRAIQYGYDVASNKTSVTTASGTTTYAYDERNRLDVVRLNGSLQADYDYDAVNNLTQTTFGNGTQETRSYDDLNRLKQLENWRGTTKLASYSYTLDKVGNRTQVDEFQNGEVRTLTYFYDDLYRLTKEVIDAAGTQNDLTQEYGYDQVGNRLWRKASANGAITQTDYTYDGNDRLLNEKVNGLVTTGYTYDNNGSTLTKTENGVTTTYTWNDEKRLVEATVNGQQMQYRYNDRGIRVSSAVNGLETWYLLDEGMIANVWEEYSPDGQGQTSYVYGNDLISQTQGGQRAFFLVDGLGSTRVLTDAEGAVLNTYAYDAFGEKIGGTGSVENKYLFAGEQFDEGLGDYYLRARYYDADTGRFTRRDDYEGSIDFPISLHTYLYANANPIKYTDPLGLFSLNEVLAVTTILDTLGTNSSYITFANSLQKAQSVLVSIAIFTYLLTTHKGPNKNNNYLKKSIFPAFTAYLDFFAFFATPFQSQVRPIFDPPGSLTTSLPGNNDITVRPFSESVYATVNIALPKVRSEPRKILKVRYLFPMEPEPW